MKLDREFQNACDVVCRLFVHDFAAVWSSVAKLHETSGPIFKV